VSRAELPYGRPYRTLGCIVALGLLVPLGMWAFGSCASDLAPPSVGKPVAAADGPRLSPTYGSVSGSVTFADGEWAHGAEVEVLGGESGELEATGAAGRNGGFSFWFGDESEEVLEVSARVGPLRVSAGGDSGLRGSLPSGVVVRLQLPPDFSVAGVVLAAETRDPVAGAHVTCVGRTANTDFRGAFEIVGIPAAAARDLPLVLEVAIDGFRPRRRRLPAEWLPGRYSDVQVLLEPAR